MVFALIALSACSPFKSEHELLLPLAERSNQHFQSYYVPKTLLTATITTSGSGKDITLRPERIADRSYLFQVNYDRSIVHDDDLFIETDDKGFLKAVQANSDDKTADIVKSAADTLLTTVGQFGFGRNRSLPDGALSGETHLLTVQIDPFDENDLGTRNRMLSAHGYCISMFDRDDEPLPGSCQIWRQRNHTPRIETVAYVHRGGTPQRAQGFFYRRPVEHKIVVHKRKGHHWVPIWAGMHRFEQQAELLEIKVDRGAFIKLQARLDFTEGVLNKYTLNKPSELLGFMAIPSTIVNAVVQIPGLTVSAYENKLNHRDRIAAAREREVKVREREAALVPVGVSPDGLRSVYQARELTNRSANRSTTIEQGSDRNRADFYALCGQQVGMTPRDCDDAWLRRSAQ